MLERKPHFFDPILKSKCPVFSLFADEYRVKALPENWIILKDKKSGKIFYYNEKTRRRKNNFPIESKKTKRRACYKQAADYHGASFG